MTSSRRPGHPAGCGTSVTGGAWLSMCTNRFVTSRRSRPSLFEANLRRAERKFDVLEELGVETMLVMLVGVT